MITFEQVREYLREDATLNEMDQAAGILRCVIQPWEPPLDVVSNLYRLRDRHGRIRVRVEEKGEGAWHWVVERDRGGLAPEYREGTEITLTVAISHAESSLKEYHYHIRPQPENTLEPEPVPITRTELLMESSNELR